MDEKIVGLGELLWDVFPDRRCPGGAPFNFAWHARMLGADAAVITRLGDDALGGELREVVRQAGFDDRLVQHDHVHPTGTVQVELKAGQPSYTIVQHVAWDFIEEVPPARDAMARAAAVCFGSLAQRSAVSAATIAALVQRAKNAKIIFDVNLRQNFYSPELLDRSLRLADVVKLNAEELATLGRMLAPGRQAAEAILQTYDLELLVETLGPDGCIVHSPRGQFRSPGFKVQVADAVGAGDAFTAALAVGLARGEPIEAVARQANRAGALVASKRGATPNYTLKDLQFIE